MTKPVFTTNKPFSLDELKSQVWEALNQKLPIPDLDGLSERPVSIFDVYYLLERWATLSIWDAVNLAPPGEKVLLKLEGTSEHFNIYDRGNCLVASPKDLFSHERTLADALQTARAMMREAYQRNWEVELIGFEKMERAAWVEAQLMEDIHGRKMEILRYNPTFRDIRAYNGVAASVAFKNG